MLRCDAGSRRDGTETDAGHAEHEAPGAVAMSRAGDHATVPEATLRAVAPDAALGQNFLARAAVLDREVAYAGIRDTDTVLEIGPGPGVLTGRLAATAARVVCIEIDRRFAPVLETLQARHPGLELHWGDATEVAFPAFDRCVANLPYRVSLPLIFKLLDCPFHTAVLVIQERLARRLVAGPGRPHYGRLGVLVQRRASLRLLETVKAAAFWPEPDVDSAMIRLRPLKDPFEVPDETTFGHLLDYAFVQRTVPVADVIRTLAPARRARDVADSLPPSLGRAPAAKTPPAAFGELARTVAAAGLQVPVLSAEEKRKAQKLWRPGVPPGRGAGPRRRG